MVQIIQSGPTAATLRQQALNQALDTAVQGYAAYGKQEKDKALTLRQQALQDQQTALQLNAQGIDASPQDLRDYVSGTYKPKEISPATPDSYAPGLISSPADLKRQDEMGNVSQVFTPGANAVMGNANPLMNYTDTKKAQIAQALKDKDLANRTAESTIAKNNATADKEASTAQFTRTYKPQQVQSQVDLSNQRQNLIDSQIDKNNTAATLAPNKAEAGTVKQLNQALLSARGDTQAQLSQKALVSASTAQALLSKPEWSNNDRSLFASELGKIATGGVPSQHEVESILPSTLAAKYGQAITFLTSTPQNVDDAQYKINAAHYLNDLKQINQEYLDARKEKIFRINGFNNLSEATKQNYRGVPEYQGVLNKIEGKQQDTTSSQSAEAPHGNTVVQNGKTFSWNPATGKYERH
jgi:hypothetical protein